MGEIDSLYFKKADGRKVSFEVMVPLVNNNWFSVTITDADLDVYMNNEYFGKIKSVENVKIHANSTEVYAFPFEVEFSGSTILKGAMTLFSLFLERQVEVSLKGDIMAKSFGFYRSIPVEESSSVSLQEIE
jgi:LEA14-like dessication related protein